VVETMYDSLLAYSLFMLVESQRRQTPIKLLLKVPLQILSRCLLLVSLLCNFEQISGSVLPHC
jgi:hypothetical protein